MKEIPLKTFLYHFCKNIREDKKFCFILGSGASKPSGIPTGAELVKQWMAELAEMYEPDTLDSWKTEEGISMDDLAKDYSKIFDKRFELDEKDGFAFLEKIMEGKEPSCGYSVLAQILDTKPHKIVITTNFDSLTEDALFIYTRKKPLVVGHEALANYIKPFGTRPIIVKIHRDLFLTPMNTTDKTSELETNFERNLTSIFKYYTPIVIGYGGNDGSLMGFLEQLDEIEGGIFWFYREKDAGLSKRIKDLIEKFNGFAIPIPGFDDLMIQIGNELELERLDKKIVEIAEQRAKNYRKQIEKVTEEKTTSKETRDAVSNMVSRGIIKDWLYYVIIAAKEKDLAKQNIIYQEGIEKLPKSADLHVTYADFLIDILKEHDKAEEFYKKAIELAPDDADNVGNYALFLSDIRKEYGKAEEFYKKAIELDPDNADNVGNYAKNLIAKKEIKDVYSLIKEAFELKQDEDEELSLELWFYRYAIFFDEYNEAVENIEILLKKGIKSIGWYLDDVLEVAKELGHPDYDKLCELEKKITAM
jgi:tetratricopeptide (TPR) repeat protein